MKKRLLSAVLVLAIVLTLLPTIALADEPIFTLKLSVENQSGMSGSELKFTVMDNVYCDNQSLHEPSRKYDIDAQSYTATYAKQGDSTFQTLPGSWDGSSFTLTGELPAGVYTVKVSGTIEGKINENYVSEYGSRSFKVSGETEFTLKILPSANSLSMTVPDRVEIDYAAVLGGKVYIPVQIMNEKGEDVSSYAQVQARVGSDKYMGSVPLTMMNGKYCYEYSPLADNLMSDATLYIRPIFSKDGTTNNIDDNPNIVKGESKTVQLMVKNPQTAAQATVTGSDGSVKYYSSVDEALAAAAAMDGSTTVTLLTNASFDNSAYALSNRNVTLDLGGHTLTFTADKSVSINSGAQLTIKNGKLIAKAFTDGRNSLFNILKNSSITLDKVDLDTTGSALYPQGDAASVTVQNGSSIKCGVYAVGTNAAAVANYNVIITLKNSSFTSAYGYNSAASKDSCPVMINIPGKLVMDNCVVNGSRQGVLVRGGSAVISNSTIITSGEYTDGIGQYLDGSWGSGDEVPMAALVVGNRHSSSYQYSALCTVTNTTIKSANSAVPAVYTYAMNDSNLAGSLKIESANVTGRLSNNGSAKLEILAGNYTDNPGAYLPANKAAVASSAAGYNYTVSDKNTAAAEVVTAGPEVAEPNLGTGATEAERNLAAEVKNALTGAAAQPGITPDAVNAAASSIANSNTLTAESKDVKSALANAKVDTTGKTVTIVIQPYMDIKITGVSIKDNEKNVTFDITPMYRTIAATDKNDIVLKAENGKMVNAALIGAAKQLPVGKSVAVTLPLPAGFANDGSLYVKHVKDNGRTYYYTGKVSANVLTFMNPNGFSKFTTMTSSEAEAELNGVGYASLSDAIVDAKDGETVTILKTGLTASMSGSSRTVKLANGTKASLDVTINGQKLTIDANGAKDFKYVRSSKSQSYKVTVKNTEGGTVTATPASASKGLTITVKVKTKDGYTLKGLEVTDAKGNKLSLRKRSDLEYSFSMPGSNVTVKPVFTGKSTGGSEGGGPTTESKLPFKDVKGHWAYDAIKFACEKKLMNGVSDAKFSPDGTLTRGMMATLLYRLEGEPRVSGIAFSDIGTDMWYTKAITWAADNKIVNGYGDGVFAPNDNITREQLAAILYRYAQYKKYDTTQGGMGIREYADSNSVSGYAVGAMGWAVNAKLMNGVTGTQLQPQGTATRAQVATMLMRFTETIAK